MFCWHKWEKWKPYTWRGKVGRWGLLGGGPPSEMRDVTEERQRRQCAKCGKTQDQRIDSR